jgi:hypothetical protein
LVAGNDRHIQRKRISIGQTTGKNQRQDPGSAYRNIYKVRHGHPPTLMRSRQSRLIFQYYACVDRSEVLNDDRPLAQASFPC